MVRSDGVHNAWDPAVTHQYPEPGTGEDYVIDCAALQQSMRLLSRQPAPRGVSAGRGAAGAAAMERRVAVMMLAGMWSEALRFVSVQNKMAAVLEGRATINVASNGAHGSNPFFGPGDPASLKDLCYYEVVKNWRAMRKAYHRKYPGTAPPYLSVPNSVIEVWHKQKSGT